MVSPQQFLAIIEAALLGPSPPSPAQRIELLHAVRSSLPMLQNLLVYPVVVSFFLFPFSCISFILSIVIYDFAAGPEGI